MNYELSFKGLKKVLVNVRDRSVADLAQPVSETDQARIQTKIHVLETVIELMVKMEDERFLNELLQK